MDDSILYPTVNISYNDLEFISESNGFSVGKLDIPPRLYFFMKTFDEAEVTKMCNTLNELAEEVSGSVLIFDYFDFDLQDTDVSLHRARDTLFELGVRNVYRVGSEL